MGKNKNDGSMKHSKKNSTLKHAAGNDPSYMLDAVMDGAKHAALKVNYTWLKPAALPVLLTCAGMTIAGLSTSYAHAAVTTTASHASNGHYAVAASYNGAASRSEAREPLMKTDSDATWGGIEQLNIGYSQSTAQKNSSDNLRKAQESARTLLTNSDGKVADNATRQDLQNKVNDADNLLKDSKTEADKLDAAASAINDAMGKVNDSVAKRNLANQQAQQRAASNQASSSADIDWASIQQPGSKQGNDVVNYAMQFVGKVPYVWGGETTGGWDCSGFVKYVYAQFGVGLPHYSGSQSGVGRGIGSLAEAQPGDIIANGMHAAIYIGNGQVVNALNPGAGTTVTPIQWAFSGGYSIRRIF